MRVLVALDFAKEHGHRKYSPTLLSKEMTDKTSGGIVDTLYVRTLLFQFSSVPNRLTCPIKFH
jgi:hypothetical protein